MTGYGANQGLVARMARDVFSTIDTRRALAMNIEVSLSILELYAEVVRDLLDLEWSTTANANRRKGLKIREHPTKGFFGLYSIRTMIVLLIMLLLLFPSRGIEERAGVFMRRDAGEDRTRRHQPKHLGHGHERDLVPVAHAHLGEHQATLSQQFWPRGDTKLDHQLGRLGWQVSDGCNVIYEWHSFFVFVFSNFPTNLFSIVASV